MKIITVIVLLASFFAIAGAALFQLFVLLTNNLFSSKITIGVFHGKVKFMARNALSLRSELVIKY